MLAQSLQHIVGQPVTGDISALEETIASAVAHRRFLERHAKDDPWITLLLEFYHRNLFAQQTSNGNVVELDAKDARRLSRLRRSFYMKDEALFADLIRTLWLMRSFSNSTKNSHWLNRISGLDSNLQVEELAYVRSFGVATYECPGLIETLPELGIGYTTLVAMATRTNPTVMLYGEEGAARNRHLAALKLSAGEIGEFYENRRQLLEVYNFSVTKIDIPQDFFSVPDNSAIAREMIELGHKASRDLDRSFVDYMVKRVADGAIERDSKLGSIVAPYISRTPTPEDYEQLLDQFRQPLKEMGLELLDSEEVHNIADLILKASDYRSLRNVEGFIKPLQSEEQQKVGPTAKEKKAGVRASIGLNERVQMWNRLLSRELTDDIRRELSADNPNFKQVERELIEKYRGKLERGVGIWMRLLPSDIATVITDNLYEVNKYFRQMGPAAAKQSIEYFMGEIIHIIRPLLADPSRAYLKFGNKTEQYWDECVYELVRNPEISADTFWLLGSFFDLRNDRKNGAPSRYSPFGSILYRHFTIRGKDRRDTYISYGIPLSRTHIKAIPLISDTPEDLLTKFSRMAEYDPDEISRIVVGAIYSLMNPGDRTAEAEGKFTRNMGVLLEAVKSLPPAYQTSVYVLNPKDIPGIIDSKIREEYEAILQMSRQGDTNYIDTAHQKISDFISPLKEKREEAKIKSISLIEKQIRGAYQTLEEALSEAENSLFTRYRRWYNQDIGTSPTQEARLKKLAEYFYSFCFIPPETREQESGASSMLEFLHRIGIDPIHDMEVDEALRTVHQCFVEVMDRECLLSLKKHLTDLNNRTAGILQATVAKGGKAQGPLLSNYLNIAVETVMHLNHRKEKSLEAIARGGDATRDVAERLSMVIEAVDEVINNSIYSLLNVVDRVDLANFLQNRYNKVQAKIEEVLNNPKGKELLQKEDISPEGEVYVLKRLDDGLRAFEDRYIQATKKVQYPSAVMFPHQLQQFSAFRNAIATWVAYYTQATLYMDGRSQSRPFNPNVVTSQAESAFSISPEHATNFFTPVLGHLRRELGEPYFASQRARVQAVLK